MNVSKNFPFLIGYVLDIEFSESVCSLELLIVFLLHYGLIINYNLISSTLKMDLAYMQALPTEGGFNYDNCIRNKALTANMGMGL